MAKTEKTYQQLDDELNRLIEWFEGDSIKLDEAADKYQEAMQLIGQMEEHLKTAENKIKKISAKFE
jgi:exodeoxyribonuclease VII small subunit